MDNVSYREETIYYYDVAVVDGNMANFTLHYEVALWTPIRPTAQGGHDTPRGAAI